MKTKQSVYDIVSTKIIDALKGDIVPWQKPWVGGDAGLPRNAISNRPYRGVNVFLLNLAPSGDPRWLTYKQAADRGGNVKKGEKGQLVIFWSIIDGKEKGDDGKVKKIVFLKYYTVFNVVQCEGLNLPTLEKPVAFDPIAEAEAIAAEYADGPVVYHGPGDRAYYRPSEDTITLPSKGQFREAGEYYATLFHELAHSTGHSNRLNRKELGTPATFGDPVYSKEELVAEFGAAFLCARAGIDNTRDNSAAYIKGWLSKLEDDPKLVVLAAAAGQKAADWILGEVQEKAQSAEETADKAA